MAILNLTIPFGFDKWNKLIQLANFKPNHHKGIMKILVAGLNFTLEVTNSGAELHLHVSTEEEAEKVISHLKSIFGSNFDVRKRMYHGYIKIVIPWVEITRCGEIRRLIIAKLREVIPLLGNEFGNEKRKKEFILLLNKLTKYENTDSIGMSI
jgi:hypothetical protein